ncbi:MAG: ribokinase [Sneathiella sp.]|nr:ribokinase [Sneathiella sp.]
MIVVFGSINIDQVYQMDVLPRAGETVHGNRYLQVPGGKGANQALAARRAGADVTMIGCVGKDANADPALSLMKADGINLDSVAALAEPTGCASIWVDGSGENSIAVIAGANGQVKATQVTDELLSKTDFLLMQMEVPQAENWALLFRAKKAGVRTLLNLAPVFDVPATILDDLDYLVVNEVEAAALAAQHHMKDLTGKALAQELSSRFDLCCVLTLGGEGAIAAENGSVFTSNALDIQPVDTTAAGDSFIGGFSAALVDGRSTADALQFAVVTAGLTCMEAGAQTSLPHRREIDATLDTL